MKSERMKTAMIPEISIQELADNIEFEDFSRNFGNPVKVKCGGRCVEKIPSDIVFTSPKEDMICVRMPEVVKDELEKIVAYKHGISLEQALQRFMVWCVEEPEKFTFRYKNAMAKSDDYDK